MEERKISRPKEDQTRVNKKIRAREIKLIGPEGEQLGVFMVEDAIKKAEALGLDLVEVAGGSTPPVCKIMDYGRHKFEQRKKTTKKGHVATLKEVKLRPSTDEHDLEVKIRKAREFLIDGDKLKITVMFRGREMVHRSQGFEQLERVKEMLGNLAAVETPAKMEGRFLAMILVPNKEGVTQAKRELDAQAKQARGEAKLDESSPEDRETAEHEEQLRRKHEEKARLKAEKAAKAAEEMFRI